MFPKFLKVAVFEDVCLNNKPNPCTDFYGQFFNILSIFLKFDYEFVISDSPAYGDVDESGNWTGVLGMVHRGEADMAPAHYYVNEKRSAGVKFCYPLESFDMVFIVKRPGVLPKYSAYLYPFQIHVWISILVMLVLMPFAVKYLVRVTRALQHLFFDLYGDLLLQGLNLRETSVRVRMWAGTFLISAMILSSAYSSLLLSFLTVPRREEGIKTVTELAHAVSKGDYAVYLRRGHTFGEIIRESPTPAVRDMWPHVAKNGWFYATLGDVQNLITKERKAIVFTRLAAAYGFGKDNPEVVISEDHFVTYRSAFPFNQKLASEVRHVDRMIHRMYAAGLIDKIRDEDLFRFRLKMPRPETPSEDPKPLKLEDLLCACFILLAGYAVSILVFIVEIVNGRHLRKRSRRTTFT